jgi:hypothetical protein
VTAAGHAAEAMAQVSLSFGASRPPNNRFDAAWSNDLIPKVIIRVAYPEAFHGELMEWFDDSIEDCPHDQTPGDDSSAKDPVHAEFPVAWGAGGSVELLAPAIAPEIEWMDDVFTDLMNETFDC